MIGKVFRLPELSRDERIVINRHGARGYLWVARSRFRKWLAKARTAPAALTDLESPDGWACVPRRSQGLSMLSEALHHEDHSNGNGANGNGTNGNGAHRTLAAQYLTPIIIPGCGRDGSTLLMQLLGTSNQIAFQRQGEFESRLLMYFVRWAQLLGRDPVPETEGAVRRSLFELGGALGHLPWHDSPLLKREPGGAALWQTCFLTAWREFSRTAAAHMVGDAGPSAPPVRYYAEKSCPWLCEQLTGVLPYKELYTLRDPRDVWLSVLAYNEKRGIASFGRRPGQSDAEFLESFLRSQKGKLAYISKLKESDTIAIARYEIMVADLPTEARRLSAFLGVTLSAEAVQSQSKNYRYHMTSASPTASVYRWKRELDPALKEKFVARLKPYLEQLGYDLS